MEPNSVRVLLAFNRYLRVCYVLSSLLDTELTGAFLVIQMAVALALGKDSGSGDGGSKHSSDIEEIESIGLVRKRSFLGVSRVLACAAGMMAVS